MASLETWRRCAWPKGLGEGHMAPEWRREWVHRGRAHHAVMWAEGWLNTSSL